MPDFSGSQPQVHPATSLRDFAGTPLVGELVGLRSFRIDDSGALLPLYSPGAWYDGANTAACAPPTGHHPRGSHPVPAPDCECGFYAYGSVAAALQNRNTRYVQAIVSCWGNVVAGTKGFRAQHARIDALWINPDAPEWLRKRVATRYPSARLFADEAAMLAEHPLTTLDCYAEPASRKRLPVLLGTAAGAVLLTLGLLPADTLQGSSALWNAWLVLVALTATATGWLLLGSHGAGHVAAAFVSAGLLAWLLAPLFGLSGWLLRMPLLRGMAALAGSYLLALRPHHFPVVKTTRERAFCGVRP